MTKNLRLGGRNLNWKERKGRLMKDRDWTCLGAVIVGLSAMAALALYVHIIGLVLERG
jgi:hypothetical protein